MNKSTANQTIDETMAIASRRKFLQQLACGSLLAIGGSGIANAAKHAAKSSAKASSHALKHATQKHHAAANSHVVKHHAGRQEVLHHAHAKHEAVKHHAVHHHHVLAHHHGHHATHHAHISHSVVDYTPASVRPAPVHYMSSYISHKMLMLKNAHTGNALKVTYFENGRYLEDALKEIDYLYQDHLTGEVYPVDPALLDQLHEVKQLVGTDRPIHIVCGYRSPLTNAYLRRQNGAVARNSLHMQGRAVDIRIEGVDTRTIRNAALAMGQGGVGYYPHANFVHLDTGDVRTW